MDKNKVRKDKVRKCVKLLLKIVADRRAMSEQGPDEPKTDWSIKKDSCENRWNYCTLTINDVKVEIAALTKHAHDISAWVDGKEFALYPQERVAIQQEVQKTHTWAIKRDHRRLVDKLMVALTTPRKPEPKAEPTEKTP